MNYRALGLRSLILLTAPLLPAALTAWLHPSAPAWHEPVSEFQELDLGAVPSGVLWVDAREPAAYAAGHIPGAVALGETAWEQGLEDFVTRWQPGILVVVYCDGERCDASKRVARRLQAELGVNEVAVLREGWPAWQKAHREGAP